MKSRARETKEVLFFTQGNANESATADSSKRLAAPATGPGKKTFAASVTVGALIAQFTFHRSNHLTDFQYHPVAKKLFYSITVYAFQKPLAPVLIKHFTN